MNEITLLRDAGPEATPLTPTAFSAARSALLQEIEAAASPAPAPGREPASVIAARQLAEDAHARHGAPAVRRRRPGRTAVLRIGAAVLTAAAAVTTAVLISEPQGATPQSHPAVQTHGMQLVTFTLPAFPLTLPTPPPGAGAPTFGADAAGTTSMGYEDAADPLQNIGISVSPVAPPPGGSLSAPGWVPEHLAVNGVPAVLVAPSGTGDPAIASLDWQRRPGQWVTIQAQGRYAERALVLSIAAALVDKPQAMPVQLHLAPAGYSLNVSKDDGRIIILADDADPERSLVVRLAVAGSTDGLQSYADVAGKPVATVTVHGKPAQLARTDLGGGGPQGWALRALLPDGSAFVVEAPGDLAAEQVVQIADQVTDTP